MSDPWPVGLLFTVWTQIRLLFLEQSDLGPHCLPGCKSGFKKFARTFSRRHKQTTFSDAGFLGILRVKCCVHLNYLLNINEAILMKNPQFLPGRIIKISILFGQINVSCLDLYFCHLPYLPYVFGQTGLSKQFRPR